MSTQIQEIIKHPWLLKYGSVSFSDPDGNIHQLLAPPSPPSPTLLATPLSSPDLIDPELYLSLKVIWGRHIDPNSDAIQRELCSPNGQGFYTKAFYYLLGKYREDTVKLVTDSHVDDADMDNSSATSADPTFNSTNLLVSGLRKHQVIDTKLLNRKPSPRATTNIHLRYDNVGSPIQVSSRRRTVIDDMVYNRKRYSRAYSMQSQPMPLDPLRTQLSVAPKDITNSARSKPPVPGATHSHLPRPQFRRGYSSVVLADRRDFEPPASAPVTSLGFSRHLQLAQSRTPTTGYFSQPHTQFSRSCATSTISNNKERPVSISTRIPTSPQNDRLPVLPPRSAVVANQRPLSAPMVTDVHNQSLFLSDGRFARKPMESLTQKANDLVLGPPQALSQHSALEVVPESSNAMDTHVPKSFRTNPQANKENQGLEEGWSHVIKYDPSIRGSAGLGGGGTLGNRDIGNIPSSQWKPKKDREKKIRRKFFFLLGMVPNHSFIF